MGEASKGAVTYSRPFWRDKELAGALYSRAGPFVQMYDQCGHTGKHAALVSWTLNCNHLWTTKTKTQAQFHHEGLVVEVHTV